jgi:hypothetical protein
MLLLRSISAPLTVTAEFTAACSSSPSLRGIFKLPSKTSLVGVGAVLTEEALAASVPTNVPSVLNTFTKIPDVVLNLFVASSPLTVTM